MEVVRLNINDATGGVPMIQLSSSGAPSPMRKRFLVVSITLFALLGASLGVSFTADTGVTQIATAATGANRPLVLPPTYTVAGGLPVGITGDTVTTTGANGWRYGTGTSAKTSVPGSPVWPTVVAGQAGSVATSGDIAMIDATDTTANFLLITIYITNMKALSLTYNSYALPIRVYAPVLSGTDYPTAASVGVTGFANGGVIWGSSAATDANGTNTGNSYLTNTQGFQTFKLRTGVNRYYAVTLDSGGSFFPFQTGATGAETTPAFYITAQRTA